MRFDIFLPVIGSSRQKDDLEMHVQTEVHCYKRLSCFASPRKIELPRLEKPAFKTGTFSLFPHIFYIPSCWMSNRVHGRRHLTFLQCRKSLVSGVSPAGAENSAEKFGPHGGNVFCSIGSSVCVAKFIIWPCNSCPWISLYIFFLFSF
jgi:hypothetical protein